MKSTWSPDNVRDLRHSLGITQLEMSQRLRVTEATIQNWEKGRRAITPQACLLLDLMKEGKV